MDKLLECHSCERKTAHHVEGRNKVCFICRRTTSYKALLRKHWDYAQSHPDIEYESPYNTAPSEAIKDRFDDVLSKFKLLSKQEKEVVELLWEEKTQQEVARIMEISQQAVGTYLKRARKKLK